MRPRIPPLLPADRDDETVRLLGPRPPGEIINLLATFVRNKRLFARWGPLAHHLLTRGVLRAEDREVLVLRTAWNCRSEYEWGQHVPIARAAGLSDEEIRALSRRTPGDALSSWHRVLAAAADDLAADGAVSQRTWGDLAADLDEAQLLEVPFVVGHWTMVAYALNSVGVELDEGFEGFS